jgi:hypothetical protein
LSCFVFVYQALECISRNPCAVKLGIKIEKKLVSLPARILSPPLVCFYLSYHFSVLISYFDCIYYAWKFEYRIFPSAYVQRQWQDKIILSTFWCMEYEVQGMQEAC